MKAFELFTLPKSLPFGDFFDEGMDVWEWVTEISNALENHNFSNKSSQDVPAGLHIEGEVDIHPSVTLPPYGFIKGPVYIGEGSQLRPGVYIRGNVIVGKNCVLGNSCEYKNCLLMDNVETPHFNYVGDSILGNNSHLGAGVILANLRLDKKNVPVYIGEKRYNTGLRKLGAILGDGAQAGCNAVLQPGTILGKNSMVGPTVAFRGYLKPEELAYS